MIEKLLMVPAMLGKRMTSRLPSYPGSLVFASVMNLVIKDDITEEMQTMLTGKLLRLSVTDMGMHFNFLWTSGGFVAGWHVDTPDLVIQATAPDFLLLASRREDADTLFFNRRLVMEGDTELGVLLKNTVDALELDIPALVKSAPGRALSAWFRRNEG